MAWHLLRINLKSCHSQSREATKGTDLQAYR